MGACLIKVFLVPLRINIVWFNRPPIVTMAIQKVLLFKVNEFNGAVRGFSSCLPDRRAVCAPARSPTVCALLSAEAGGHGAAVSICGPVFVCVHRVIALGWTLSTSMLFEDFVTQSLRPRVGGEQRKRLSAAGSRNNEGSPNQKEERRATEKSLCRRSFRVSRVPIPMAHGSAIALDRPAAPSMGPQTWCHPHAWVPGAPCLWTGLDRPGREPAKGDGRTEPHRSLLGGRGWKGIG